MMKLDNDLEELSKGVNSGYSSMRDPVRGTAQVYTIQAIRHLTKTIVKLNAENSKLSNRIFLLTVFTALLVFIQVVIAVVQIIALRSNSL